MNGDELFQTTTRHARQLWFEPEIARRKNAGKLQEDFVLRAAQVVMNMGEEPVVRLNEEVKGVVWGRAKRAIAKGERAKTADFAEITGFDLTSEDADAGHLTLIAANGGWFLAFDFRYNADRITKIFEVAGEFLEAARFCAERGNPRAFCDNLFSAVELTAKGTLLITPDSKLFESRKHQKIAVAYNRWGKLGNVDPRYVRLLNRLSNLRSSARYLNGSLSLAPTEIAEMMRDADEMLLGAIDRLPRRIRVPA